MPEIVGDEDLAAVLSGQDEVGPFALEIGGEEKVRVGDGYDGAVRLNGYRRCAVAHVKRLTPRVKHDLTLSGRSPNPTLGPSSRRHRFAAAVLNLEALRRLAGAYYSVTQILRDARNSIPGASAV